MDTCGNLAQWDPVVYVVAFILREITVINDYFALILIMTSSSNIRIFEYADISSVSTLFSIGNPQW